MNYLRLTSILAALLATIPGLQAGQLAWSGTQSKAGSRVVATSVQPGARIAFYDGTKQLGTSLANEGGVAQVPESLVPGAHYLRAVEWGTGRSVANSLHVKVAPRGPQGFQAAKVVATGTVSSIFEIGDLDGDGRPDLVLAGSGTLTTLLNRANGVVRSSIPRSPSRPVGLFLLDLNGDGRNDIALAQTDGQVAIQLNRGDGRFDAPAHFRAGQLLSGFASADFNSDGIPDFVIADASCSCVSLAFGRGDGTLERGPVTGVQDSPNSLVVGDLNNDGHADVAVSLAGDGALVLLGSGTGHLRPTNRFSVPPGSSRILAVDVNEDDYADLAVANEDAGTLQVLLNQRNGNFEQSGLLLRGHRVAVTDINGDGHADFVMQDQGVLHFQIGGGSGVFTQSSIELVSSPAIAVLSADLDGQGLTDLVTLDASGIVSLIQGVAAPGQTTVLSGVHAIHDAIGFAAKQLSNLTGTTTTTATLQSSANPLTLGQSLTLTASVSPAAATGYVTFFDGATAIGSRNLVSGQASLVTNLLPAGFRTVKVLYGGDSTYAPSSSTWLTQSITALPQNGVQAKVDYSTSSLPFGVAMGDFNADGQADLVVANSGTTTIGLLLGNGNGTFQTQTTWTVGTQPVSLTVGDFNRDGKADVAVANATTGDVSILLGNGNGTFQTAVAYTAGSSPQYITTGDLNGDGIADLAVANSAGNNITVLLGNGDGAFQPGTNFNAGTTPWSIAIADFNGDGRADMAVANNGTGNLVSILLGNGDGTFQTSVNYAAGTQPSSVAAADLNGDGKVDIVVSDLTNSSGNVSVLLGRGDGTFQARVGYLSGSTPSTAGARSVAIGDFNADGIPDLAVANRGGSNLSILPGTGTGTFSAATTLATASTPQSLVLGDFNGDGRTDVAVAASGGNKVSVLLGLGLYPDLTVALSHTGGLVQGQVGVPYSMVVSNSGVVATSGLVTLTATLPQSLTATAISGTGWACTLATLTCTRADALATGSSYQSVTVTVNIGASAPVLVTVAAAVSGGAESNTSNNTASDPAAVIQTTTLSLNSSANPAILGQSVSITANVAPSAATGSVTFYDGVTPIATRTLTDGQAILTTTLLPTGSRSLTARYGGDTTYQGTVTAGTLVLQVQAQQQNGFQAALTYSSGNLSPVSATVGDFNGDGIPDLAISHSGSASKVSVLLGGTAGVFSAAVSYTAGGANSSPVSLVTSDVNGDGKADLVVANRTSNNVSVLLGNGNGIFQAAANYSVGTRPEFVVVGDFNGDGLTDLAVANSGTNNVSILLGSGSGAFQTAVNFAAGAGARAIAIGDYNGDGKADLAVLNNTSATVSLLAGAGDGTFQLIGTVATGPNPRSIASADLNGDGKYDLAVANGDADNVSVLLGNGNATFASGVSYATGSGPSSVAIADLNGDGFPDLVAANSGSGNVSVLNGGGDGTFADAVSYTAGGGPAFLTAADFNGDGLADVAVVNQNSNDISILLGGLFYSDITIAKSHTGNFTQGQTGAVYTLTVSNVGQNASRGAVIVTDNKPTSLTVTGISGSGWTCTVATASCFRTDSLAVGNSYPAISVTFTVKTNAPAQITNTATVQGGSELNTSNNSASDPTTIIQTTLLSFATSPAMTFGQPATLTASVSPTTATGTVTFMDGATVLGTSSVVGGEASLQVASLSAGPHSLTANYSGDAAFSPATTSLSAHVATATAQVTLSNLSAVYDGNAKSATVSVNPTGLTFSVTYGGSPTPPTLPGSYNVVATVNDPNYSGSGSGTLVIAKIPASIALGNLALVYDGTPRVVTATTNPSGMTYSVTYAGQAAAPTAAGSYPVVATIVDPTRSGSVTGTLVVSQAAATVSLDVLSAVYDGAPKSPVATTVPAGLNVSFTYNGSPQAPANAGTYSVTGTITDANYSGSASGSFVIAKGVATVTLGNLAATWDGAPKAVTTVTTPVGLAVTVSYNGSSTPPGNVGQYPVQATVADANYSGTTTGTLIISPAAVTMTISNLTATYTGSPNPVSVTTNPSGLAVSVTYDGSPVPPSAAGSYAVVATVTEPGHSGTASATLVVGKAPANVVLSSLTSTYDGTPKAPVVSTTPSGLQVALTYGGSPNQPTNAGSYGVIATISDPNYLGSATGTLVIGQATATISLSSLSSTYDGAPKAVSAVTAPAGLNVTYTYNGGASVPVNAGQYSVAATINSVNYMGTSSGTLVISRAPAQVNVGNVSAVYDGQGKGTSVTTIPANLAVSVTYNGISAIPTRAGSYVVSAAVNDPNYVGSGSGTVLIQKATPAIVWPQPSNMTFGTTLGPNQLKATANVPGIFVYSPAAGTVLPVGNGQVLSTTFIPADNIDYLSPVASVSINVLPSAASGAPVQMLTSKNLTRDSGNNVVVVITLANLGGTDAQNVVLTDVKLSGLTGSPLPLAVGTIRAQTATAVTVVIPASNTLPGGLATMTLAGTFTGSKFSSTGKVLVP